MHAIDDLADRMRGKQKTRRQCNGSAHEQEYAQVFADVVLELAGESLGKWCHRSPTNQARKRARALRSLRLRQGVRRASEARDWPSVRWLRCV